MSLFERFVMLPGDIEIAYAEQGASDGIPVILVHGYADSWRSFEPLLEHLPASLHAFAVSQRGHGNSTRPTTGYSTETLAEDLIHFMGAVGVAAAVLVGGSGGGMVARRVAIHHPTCARALVFLGSPLTLRDHPGVREFRDQVVSKLEDPVPQDFVREFQQSTLAQAVPVPFLDAIVAESCKLPAALWRATLDGLLDDNTDTQLGQIRAPTLAIWGDNDATIPRGDQERLVAAIGSARLTVLEGAGHALYWEEPERTAQEIAAFIDALATMTTGR